jgi:hypothetical protein
MRGYQTYVDSQTVQKTKVIKSQLPLRHSTRISTMRKTCHKNNKREKNLTLLNEIYWRKITYLYVGLSTKISICIFQLSTRISSTLVFRRHYVPHTFLHYDVTSSLRKSWENPCYLGETSCNYVHFSVFIVSHSCIYNLYDILCNHLMFYYLYMPLRGPFNLDQ